MEIFRRKYLREIFLLTSTYCSFSKCNDMVFTIYCHKMGHIQIRALQIQERPPFNHLAEFNYFVLPSLIITNISLQLLLSHFLQTLHIERSQFLVSTYLGTYLLVVHFVDEFLAYIEELCTISCKPIYGSVLHFSISILCLLTHTLHKIS